MGLTGRDTDVEVALFKRANHLDRVTGQVHDRAHQSRRGEEQIEPRVLTGKLGAGHEAHLQHHGNLAWGKELGRELRGENASRDQCLF